MNLETLVVCPLASVSFRRYKLIDSINVIETLGVSLF